MGKIRKIFLLCFFLITMLSGCGRPETAGPPVVTEVDITCVHGGKTLTRCYTGHQKMEPVLNYLRLLDDQGKTNMDPERVIGDVYQIRIRLSDGTAHVYWQRADRYLSRDRHAWRLVDRDQAKQLYGILQEMPSDV